MRRRYLSLLAVCALAAGLAAFLVVGCGGGSSTASPASSLNSSAAALSAQEIVDQSNKAMAKVTSASFVGDMAMTIRGDTTKMEDPAARTLLGNGVSLHVEGASATDPVAADMDVSIKLGDQVLDLGVLAQGDNMWVSYQDQWYKADQKDATPRPQKSTAPMEQLKDFGIDPGKWEAEYTLVGTETAADGATVYHVKATANPQKIIDALVKAANDPGLAKALDDDEAAAELRKELRQNQDDIATLRQSLKDVAVDYWIGVDDMLVRKAQFAANMDMTGQDDTQGVEGLDLDMTLTMADFNEPVTVQPPADAKPLDKLMQGMFGGMMMGV